MKKSIHFKIITAVLLLTIGVYLYSKGLLQYAVNHIFVQYTPATLEVYIEYGMVNGLPINVLNDNGKLYYTSQNIDVKHSVPTNDPNCKYKIECSFKIKKVRIQGYVASSVDTISVQNARVYTDDRISFREVTAQPFKIEKYELVD